MTSDTVHRASIEFDGVTLSYLECGQGPTVILAHGFPETAYSWRHQITFLAAHGYRVVAPDLRGYGHSSKPSDASHYSIFHLSGDMVSLVEALEIQTAVIVGHDWGAPVAWHSALFRPDVFVGVVGLSVPYRSRRSHAAPISMMRSTLGDTTGENFYMVYFQESGIAEEEFEHDIDYTVRCFLYGETPSIQRSGWQRLTTESGKLLTGVRPAALLPDWLSEHDIAHYVEAFSNGGFRGPLNYYRNLDSNWELTRAFNSVPISIPSLYIVGEHDLTRRFSQRAERDLELSLTDLRGHHIIQGAGHWIQQEKPHEVNELLRSFLDTLVQEQRLTRSS
jgi:pimeloyl-ACP methyl ester carboxylesterase